MPAKYSPVFLSLLVLLSALTLLSSTFGQQTAEDFVKRGKAKMGKGDPDGAMADYSKAIELNPKYAIAYFNRGFTKFVMIDWDGAIADFTKAIELDPKHASGYTNRGNARKAKGDRAGADADFAKAANLQGH